MKIMVIRESTAVGIKTTTPAIIGFILSKKISINNQKRNVPKNQKIKRKTTGMLKNRTINQNKEKNVPFKPNLKHITVTGFTDNAFNSTPAKAGVAKLKNAKKDIVDAGMDFGEALKLTVKHFKSESAIKITETELKIADFKKKIATSNNEIAAVYQQQVDKLEETKARLISALETYKDVGESKWEAFKHQFAKDLLEFENEIEGFVKNFSKH